MKAEVCDVCNKKFTSINELDEHLAAHINGDEESNEYIETFFPESIAIEPIHTEETKQLGDKMFTSISDLSDYFCVRAKNKDNTYNECTTPLPPENNLSEYLHFLNKDKIQESNNGNKTLICSDSQQESANPESKEKSLICNTCKKDCSDPNVLEHHSFLHNTVKSDACDTCGRKIVFLSCFYKDKDPLPPSEDTHTSNDGQNTENNADKGIETITIADGPGEHNDSEDTTEFKRIYAPTLTLDEEMEEILAKEKLYPCTLCTKICTEDKALKKHMQKHAESLSCNVCYKAFNRVDSLYTHLRLHTGEKPYVCSVCNMSFTRQSSLRNHSQLHNKEKSYECIVCNKRFARKSKLDLHFFSHAGDKPEKCDTCNKTFLHKYSLKQHLLTHTIHTVFKPFTCDYCDKGFSRSECLRDHVRIHTGEKPYKCNICNKGFTQASGLRYHSFTHNKEKPHACTICTKSFARKDKLEMHYLTHTGEKPHQCETCDKAFTREHLLKEHMLTHENRTNENLHKCSICEKTFTRSSYVRIHMRIHTGEKPFACHVCDKRFTQSCALYSHSLRHTEEKDAME
ncbi:zinc finger protein 658 [Trichonephila clavipes]|uniref:Zinc finger protein 658 n=1 Tax=Trichonephila clavipes TaxID=2585209 RepID=A0A8X6WH31_TRICX|nr:zinc finger protein 658 [Trichonephila clavipes]